MRAAVAVLPAQGTGGNMVRRFTALLFTVIMALGAMADNIGQPALTIYNRDFAVVRQPLTLDLKAGSNQVRFTDVTLHLEPDSVVLRDPAGRRLLQVLEQNYRNDPVSQELMLSLYEGRTIDFVTFRNGKEEIVPGKII